MNADGRVLVGMDGGNPLAFLAALGTLRSLASVWPDRRVRMSWRPEGVWRPVLHLDCPAGEAEIVQALDGQLKRMRGHEIWDLGPDLKVSPGRFREFALQAARHAQLEGDRSWADFASAFGSEATVKEDSKKGEVIQDTELRAIGAGNKQELLSIMKHIVNSTEPMHLAKTLFQPWRYDDPVEKQTLRWDPADDVRRALRWRDPSGDPQRGKRGGMLGANRLAIEGLPLLPTIPVGRTLRTTGFSGRGSGTTHWTWPLWSDPLVPDVVRSLVAHPGLQADLSDPRRMQSLADLGIAEVYRSRRLTVDKFRCFTPGIPL